MRLSFVNRIENKIEHIRQVCVKIANYLAEIIITLFFLMGSDIKSNYYVISTETNYNMVISY